VLNVEPVCGSVGVGYGVANMGLILLGVDPEPIATGFTQDVEPSFIEPEFMPEYKTTFGDECAKDSIDDRLVPELSNRDKTLLQQTLAEHAPDMSGCRDLSQDHQAITDGLWFNDSVPLINHGNIFIRKGIIFKTYNTYKAPPSLTPYSSSWRVHAHIYQKGPMPTSTRKAPRRLAPCGGPYVE
jgi:hypothetical protein